MNIRTMLAVLTLSATIGPAIAAEQLPDRSCSKSFVSDWLKDSEKAMSNLPKQACVMHAASGPYVCDQEGCTQAEAYLENHRN